MNQWLNGRRGSANAAWNTQATSTSGAARRWERARTERLKLGGAQVGPNAQSPANWALRQIPAQSLRKKAPKGQKAAPKDKKSGVAARDGSKTAKVLDLLKRPDGATLKELMKLTGWQNHSLRGSLSGTVGKKRGLAVTSTKGEDGERSYSVKG